jgi:(p)ppGpp synthase/HD superfamily hydrolase
MKTKLFSEAIVFSAAPLQDNLQSLHLSERYARTRELLTQFEKALDILDLSESARRQILDARDLSVCAHFYQADRADGQPYINHPIQVALTLVNKFGFAKPEAVIAALLHDTIEDQSHRLIELLGDAPPPGIPAHEDAKRLLGVKFGSRVAEIVSRLTNPDFHELAIAAQLPGDKRSSAELVCHLYKEHFLQILERDPEAFLVKLSDFSQNAFAVGALSDDSKKASLKARYGPVLLSLVERLQAIPSEGHILTPWKETLATELLWVYARDYAA